MGAWSPKPWRCSTGRDGTRSPKNWPLRPSRTRPHPKRRPRFAFDSQRSPSTVRSDVSMRAAERCSWRHQRRHPRTTSGLAGLQPHAWRHVSRSARGPKRLPRQPHRPVISRPRSWSDLTLACLDWQDGYAGRAVRRLEELSTLARTGERSLPELLLANNYANLPGGRRPSGRGRRAGQRRHRAGPTGTECDGARYLGCD